MNKKLVRRDKLFFFPNSGCLVLYFYSEHEPPIYNYVVTKISGFMLYFCQILLNF